MFSFLKFLNSKPNDTDKNETTDNCIRSLNYKKLDLKSPKANTHNNIQPMAFTPSQTISTFRVKRRGDFSANISHPQKKAKTRNNEILSSYSSSKFLLKPGRKRPYQTDNLNCVLHGDKDEWPDHKHCKNCFCRGSTVLPENDQNILNRSVRIAENDLSDNLVTVAAGRIFNRSGKTQVIKKLSMKTILDEILDDVDLTPYTSIEKVEEKKKKSQNNGISLKQHRDKPDLKNNHHPTELTASDRSVETGISFVDSAVTSVQKTSINTTPFEGIPQVNKESTNCGPLQFDFDHSKMSPITSTESSNKQISIKVTTNQLLAFRTPKSTVKFTSKQHVLPFQSPGKNENGIAEGQCDSKNDNDNHSFQSTTSVSKSSKHVTNTSVVVHSSECGVTALPSAIQLGDEKSNTNLPSSFTLDRQVEDFSKQSTTSYDASMPPAEHSIPLMRFDATMIDSQQSLPNIQFEIPKVNDKLETRNVQFGFSEVDGIKSIPVVHNSEFERSTSVYDFGAFLTESNSKQNFGQIDPLNCDAICDKSTPFGALPAPHFGTSKPFANQPVDNQEPNLEFGFGDQLTADGPAKSTSDVLFINNNANTGTSATHNFGVNAAFQFGSSRVKESQTQFTTPVFGSQNTTTVPIKFEGNEKPAEPLKFESTVSSGSAFQFGDDKSENGPVEFGQVSNAFHASGSNGFGNSAPQQSHTIGNVPLPPTSLFGNMASCAATTFGTNQNFQYKSTNNNHSNSSTFALGTNNQSTIGGAQLSGLPGASRPLFSLGTAPAAERRVAKAVRRRQ